MSSVEEAIVPPPELPSEIAQVRALLTSPPKPKGTLLWLMIGIVIFVLTSRDNNWFNLAIIVVVLFIHEAGHLLGMKLFGFSDLKMFFIPFFGAAASGRKLGASAFEHSVVLLLGPLPGILIGTALTIAMFFVPNPRLGEIGVLFFTSINVFNLLPISPFDGGRLFERLVFNRLYWLEFLFRLLTIAALAGLAFLLRAWIFGVLAAFLLLGLRIHMKRAHAAYALVTQSGPLPSDPDDLSDEQVLDLLASANTSLEGVAATGPTLITLRTQAVLEIFDRASSRLATPLETIGCLMMWAAGLVLSVMNFVVWQIALLR